MPLLLLLSADCGHQSWLTLCWLAISKMTQIHLLTSCGDDMIIRISSHIPCELASTLDRERNKQKEMPHPMKLGMPIMEGMGMSLTQMEFWVNLRARMSRAASITMAAPKEPPAIARQFLGRSLEPCTATRAMFRKTGANGALQDNAQAFSLTYTGSTSC